MKAPTVYYISQGETPEAHLRHIEEMAIAGVDWVQLRLKNITRALFAETAQKAVRICKQYRVVCIINDAPEIAKAVNADGVHLGKEDGDPVAARALLGRKKIIGGTANTLGDCCKLRTAGVDYIGLGPFRFTTTKEKLSPVLGIAGYQNILKALREEAGGPPVIAIGGITVEDSRPLQQAGAAGVALSGFLHGQRDPAGIIKSIKNQFNQQTYAAFR